MLIYETNEIKGYKDYRYTYRYYLEGNIILRYKHIEVKIFDGKENAWSEEDKLINTWSKSDPNLPTWLKNKIK